MLVGVKLYYTPTVARDAATEAAVKGRSVFFATFDAAADSCDDDGATAALSRVSGLVEAVEDCGWRLHSFDVDRGRLVCMFRPR